MTSTVEDLGDGRWQWTVLDDSGAPVATGTTGSEGLARRRARAVIDQRTS